MDHYIEGIVYPEEHTNLVRLGVVILVLVSWLGHLWRRRPHPRRKAGTDRPPPVHQG
ncbi:hypothetical protein ACFQX6_23105 [Streptosporangium lutulentum]